MRLHRMYVEGFKRINKSEVLFGEATFLIGANNAGKSSALRAIEWLLSDKKQLDPEFYCTEIDPETGEQNIVCKTVVLEAEFRNVPTDAINWRGFKGRVFDYDPETSGETGKRIFYRKTYELGENVSIELKSFVRTLKPAYAKAAKADDLISGGANEALVLEIFPDRDKKFGAAEKLKLQLIDEVWDLSEEEVWDKNPGGIAGVVLSRLPTYLLVPAEYSANEIDSKSGVLQKTLNELFKDVRANSKHYQVAQSSLNELAKELDPSDGTSEFGKMMAELNGVLSGVFPDSKILASADLSNPDSALVPSFEIQMASNIRSSVAHQGTGMVRAAVFGLLRFRQQWIKQRAKDDRGLIIGFEEPEIYLHPSAANQMRDIIYELSGKTSQIVATTHSPYLIDLARKPRQVLNRFYYDSAHTTIHPFSVSDEFSKLQASDKDQVKMLLRLDDHAARIFFTRKVILVEGDTEEIVLKEAIRRMDAAKRAAIQSRTEILKARGTASIIGLVKYLSALGVSFFVIHDRDQGTPGAEIFNEPIRLAAGSPDKVAVIQECIEDLLGYAPPSSEKPYKAYQQTLQWGDDWDGVPTALKELMTRAFAPYLPAPLLADGSGMEGAG